MYLFKCHSLGKLHTDTDLCSNAHTCKAFMFVAVGKRLLMRHELINRCLVYAYNLYIHSVRSLMGALLCSTSYIPVIEN